jgi:hypothetical protein
MREISNEVPGKSQSLNIPSKMLAIDPVPKFLFHENWKLTKISGKILREKRRNFVEMRRKGWKN